MTDPHYHEEHVERRPATRRIVTERRRGGTGFGYGGNPVALVVAALLFVLILVLIFGFLL